MYVLRMYPGVTPLTRWIIPLFPSLRVETEALPTCNTGTNLRRVTSESTSSYVSDASYDSDAEQGENHLAPPNMPQQQRVRGQHDVQVDIVAGRRSQVLRGDFTERERERGSER